jgi:glyoxylase-like metal-dependent hydrolase (beta-lactamase superfamily II)
MQDRIKNAVQPEAWYRALPRPGYASLTRVHQSQPWFKVYELPHATYAIYEPGHFQEVISFLILGEEQALLLDTGMGIGNMRRVVEELTDLPVTVVNSHCHFDHIGCNRQFPAISVFNHPGAIQRLQSGMQTAEVVHHLAGDSTWVPYPSGFDPETYAILPSVPEPIEDGHVFDLGNRTLQVIHTPGHSPDSIMLYEPDARILFTGDTFYPATLYTHLTSHDGITSDFALYRKVMRDVATRFQPAHLYPSHNEPLVPGDTLVRVADAFDRIAAGNAGYRMDDTGLRKYDFDGFAIVTRDLGDG